MYVQVCWFHQVWRLLVGVASLKAQRAQLQERRKRD